MQVEQLYAEKKLSDGDLAAAAFRGMVQSGEVQILPGERANFLRAADQAKLFARYNPQGNSQMTERKMPGVTEKPAADDGLTAM